MNPPRTWRTTTTPSVPLAPDPNDVWEDPFYLLDLDPPHAYRTIEELLVDPLRLIAWGAFARAIGKAAFDSGIQAKESGVSSDMLDVIEEIGFVPAAELGEVTPERAAALLRDADIMEETHKRIWCSDSPYWERRRKIKTPEITPKPIPSQPAFRTSSGHWRAVAAIVLLVTCTGAGAVGTRLWLSEKLEQLARYRQQVAKLQEEYDSVWEDFRFEEVVQPTFRHLSAARGGSARVRVELSPRVAEGLVRDVSVCWGDAGDFWQPIYEAEGTTKGFEAIHDYAIPAPEETRSWTLKVAFSVPDAVARARRLTPDQLISACVVQATTEGIRLLPPSDSAKGPPRLLTDAHPNITWLTPVSGSNVGWKTTVELLAHTTAERVTLLVRPVTGSTFYVQAGARSLSAGLPASIPVQLGGGPGLQVGEDFDILVICSDSFRPSQWSLDASEVPHSCAIGRITVRKAAGTVHLAQKEEPPHGLARIQGQIWTVDGGSLLVLEEGGYRVVKTIPPSPVGGRFDVELDPGTAASGDVYLMVRQYGSPQPHVGEVFSQIPADLYWLYGPAEELNEK